MWNARSDMEGKRKFFIVLFYWLFKEIHHN